MELPNVFNETLRILKGNATDLNEIDWTCRYIFILWMSLLIQCPFDLKRIFRNWTIFATEFIDEIIRNQFLKGSGGKELEAAAILMASLLKRPEMNLELSNFLTWAHGGDDNYTLGILTTLCQLGKLGNDEILLPNLDKINEIVTITESKLSSTANKMILKVNARLAQIRMQKLGEPVQLNQFLSALKHRDTIIRWTAAKAIRRIISVCDKRVKGQVSANLLKLLESELNSQLETSPHSLHGILLAIGQLLNYRLFVRDDEDLFTTLIVKCLKFDQIKGSYAVGSFVRDAACYVVWSLARYNSALIRLADDHCIIAGLTCMALFDREVAGRRAASAALQEFIGRIGVERQTSYLPLLTHLHFFSVSAMEKSFRVNAMEISKELVFLVPDLIAHLLQVCLFNFDKNVRILAAETLGNLFSFDSQNLVLKLIEIHQKSDDLFAMHGALLSMAALPCDQHETAVIEISLQADRIPPKSLGADLLLEGHLKLIASIAIKMNETSPDSLLNSWIQTIISGLKSRSDDLRQTALESLNSISLKFGNSLEQFYLSALAGIEKERDANYQKGLISALSTCNDAFFSKNGNVIIKLLLKTAKTIVPINDIEKRCVAIEAIERILCRFDVEIVDKSPIKECLVTSLLCDYSIDTRGDVGSKVRLAALKLAQKLPKSPEIDNLVLEQVFGRLDRLRIPAMAFFFPETLENQLSIEQFALKIISKESKIPLSGTFRGLIFSCGGLDPEMTESCALIIKHFISKWGSSEFEETAMSALTNDDRLCIPVILTVTNLLTDLSSEFLESFSTKLIDSVISKTSNIRKLIPAFNLLIKINCKVLIGKYSEFLLDQKSNHKFPVIRQLIESSLN